MDISDILASIGGPTLPLETQDLRALTRLWVTERSAPELLPWPAELVERTMGRIAAQVEVIEEQTGSMDPRTSFGLIVLQTEMERVRFLVRGWLRARLMKIDAHPLHYASAPFSANLSSSESQYLHAHQSLLSSHFAASFLAQFPAQLQRLDDTAGGVSMVSEPEIDSAVFVRALRDVGVLGVPGRDERWEVKRGDVWVLRWRVVREAVGRGDVELI